MDYVRSFIKKICTECPNEVEFSIGEKGFIFKQVIAGKAKSALIRYEGKSSDNETIIFEFHHTYIPGEKFNRLEIKIPGRKAQITCFHFANLGFVSGEPVIDITQTIQLSGRNKEVNKIKKEIAENLLRAEEFLYSDNEKKWYLGTFSNKNQEWLFGKDTKSFISDFLKLGVIMAYVRGATSINIETQAR